jgi:hypothetical protein
MISRAFRAGLAALRVSRSLLVLTALSGDRGVGLWNLQMSHVERDNHLTYDRTEFADVRQVERVLICNS